MCYSMAYIPSRNAPRSAEKVAEIAVFLEDSLGGGGLSDSSYLYYFPHLIWPRDGWVRYFSFPFLIRAIICVLTGLLKGLIWIIG